MAVVARFAACPHRPAAPRPCPVDADRLSAVGWRLSRATGAQLRLRIEDIDTDRSRSEYTAAIMGDLRWLGLDWDGPMLLQSTRRA